MSIPSTGLSKYEKPGGELGTRSARGPPAPRDPFFVTINEAGRLLGIRRTTLYKLVAEKKLKLKKIGRRSLIVFESIRELIEEGDEEAA
jgi:excisionase family DNA binding protein